MENTPPPYGSPPTPPPYVPVPQPQPRPRKSRGWMIFALILLLLLGLSVLMNIGSLFSSLLSVDGIQTHHTVGPRLEEVMLENQDTSAKILVVPVEGIITSQGLDGSGVNMVEVIKAQLKRADKDSSVKAVILKVDSPGGEVLASDDIAKAITDFQKKSKIPVIACMGSLAASGGYYVSAPCRYIIAHELTITGSIGVIMSSWNYRGLMNKVGVQPMTFKSGKFKDMLSGSREPGDISDEEKEMVQKLINETYGRFKTVVSEGRRQSREANDDKGKELASNWTEYADGRILSGKEAFSLGFVDEVGDFDYAVKRTKEMVGIEKADLVEYRRRIEFGDLFGMFGKSESRAIKVDLGVDMPKLQAGRLYFLPSIYLN